MGKGHRRDKLIYRGWAIARLKVRHHQGDSSLLIDPNLSFAWVERDFVLRHVSN